MWMRLSTAAAALLLSLAVTEVARAGRHFAAGPGEEVSDGLIVRLRDGARFGGAKVPARFAASSRWRALSLPNVYRVQVDAADHFSAGEALAADPAVEFVEPDRIRHVNLITPSDPKYREQWNLPAIHALQAWQWFPGRYLTASLSLDRVRVAVLDTGADCSHPDFANAGNSSTDSANGGQLNWLASTALQATTVTDPPCAWQDDFGHGTVVAGIVGAATNNAVGVAALGSMVELMIVKVAGSNGQSTDSVLATGILYAVEKGARVINMSLAGAGYSRTLQNAVDVAWGNNVVLIGAVGNSGRDAPVYPAANHHVLGVGAFDVDGSRAAFSNRGAAVDVVAPGVSIQSTSPVAGTARYGALYHTVSGTSMAAPHVAALAGLLAMASPGASSDEIARRIQRSSDLAIDGWSTEIGYGRIDAERAITGSNWRTASNGGAGGQIRDAAGLALEGATVTLNSIAQTTDETGFFRFTAVAPGDYTMTVAAAGLTTLNVPVTISVGADTPVHVRMGVVHGTLRGTVTAGGSAAAGLIVAAWRDGLQHTVAVTNASGQYRLFVPAETYEIRVGGMFSTTATLAGQTIAGGATVQVSTLSIQNFGRLEGTVRNAANSLVSGAQIVVSKTGRSFGAPSGPSGEYRTIPGPGGTYLASAEEASAGVSQPSAVSIVDNTTSRLDMVMRTTGQTTSLTPVSLDIDARGGARSATVATGSSSLAWTASSNSAWLTLTSPAAGSGSSTLNYSVASNPGAATRSGRIQVNEAILTVTQTGATASVVVDPTSFAFPETGGSRSFAITSSGVWVAVSEDSWLTPLPPASGSGNGNLSIAVANNLSNLGRTGRVRVNGVAITITQPPASIFLDPTSASVSSAGGDGSFGVGFSSPGTPWSATSDSSWLTVTGVGFGQGNANVAYRAASNTSGAARTGTINVNGAIFTLTQSGAAAFQLSPSAANFTSSGGPGAFSVSGAGGFTAVSNADWISVVSTAPPFVGYEVAPNLSSAARSGTISVGASLFNVTQQALQSPGGGSSNGGLHFVPVQPCRVVDTRSDAGQFGKPALAAGAVRSFTVPSSGCGIPSTAKSYAVNVTVVPAGPLGYVTIFPAGQTQPLVSTLNSIDGRVKANAAIVPAGTGGAINVFATNATQLVIDINGYFIEPGTTAEALAFYPVTPCRVLDTRNPNGSLGGPILAAGTARSFPVLSSNCGIPSNARAYSTNATVVPSGPLGFLTLFQSGRAQPLVSTLNAPTGAVVANAAILPAGDNGAISAYVSGASHLVIDINGYFAPPGGATAQRFFPVSPCRVADSRNPNGGLGGPVLAANQTRTWPLPSSSCGLPASATAYSLNATVVPTASLGYLTMWPAGQTQPLVSTLNAIGDPIVANAAIVPAGTSGSIATFVTHQTHLILDTNGYFAP